MGGRILGVDAGERRVGLAVSDELQMLARPLTVLRRQAGGPHLLEALGEVARAEGVVGIVVGLPLNEDGSVGRQARRAQHFAARARETLGLPVELWDERLSTVEAEAIVRAQGRSTRRLRERGEMDAVAAAVILQDYLDHGRRRGPQ